MNLHLKDDITLLIPEYVFSPSLTSLNLKFLRLGFLWWVGFCWKSRETSEARPPMTTADQNRSSAVMHSKVPPQAGVVHTFADDNVPKPPQSFLPRIYIVTFVPIPIAKTESKKPTTLFFFSALPPLATKDTRIPRGLHAITTDHSRRFFTGFNAK
ncbi:hypothetical protein K440DRAFT_151241 [Wilcoxina mikolae CBS 423.85]|nr:hypothetical protein K440DRAFT_151241 [Wilcoxina mikolae CBS 423.85]